MTTASFTARLAADRPFFIAHRGCTALAPENTAPSFLCAARLGLHAIETDVHLTADCALVCIHDDTPERMFGCAGRISEMRLDELRTLTAVCGNGLDRWPRESLRIPTFAEYLDICEEYDRVPFIETKGDVVVVAPVIDELRRRGLISVAVLSSIEFGHIEEARRLDKDIFVHHIFSKPELLGELAAIGNAGLSYDYPDLDEVPPGLVERVHAKGVKLCLRAGDTPEAVARMLAIGLDYIPTNRAIPL